MTVLRLPSLTSSMGVAGSAPFACVHSRRLPACLPAHHGEPVPQPGLLPSAKRVQRNQLFMILFVAIFGEHPALQMSIRSYEYCSLLSSLIILPPLPLPISLFSIFAFQHLHLRTKCRCSALYMQQCTLKCIDADAASAQYA